LKAYYYKQGNEEMVGVVDEAAETIKHGCKFWAELHARDLISQSLCIDITCA
jgi:hypothetical protein